MPHGPELTPGEAFNVGCAFALVWLLLLSAYSRFSRDSHERRPLLLAGQRPKGKVIE